VDAEWASLIIGGRDNASAFAVLRVGTDDNGKISQRGIEAFLDRRIKRVHVDVHDDAHEL
jgi:hypothetical protein